MTKLSLKAVFLTVCLVLSAVSRDLAAVGSSARQHGVAPETRSQSWGGCCLWSPSLAFLTCNADILMPPSECYVRTEWKAGSCPTHSRYSADTTHSCPPHLSIKTGFPCGWFSDIWQQLVVEIMVS